MNETKHNIEISGAIIEQLSSLNEEEPTKYWRHGLRVKPGIISNGVMQAFVSESAAWKGREILIERFPHCYITDRSPYALTVDGVTAEARSLNDGKVEVFDETGTVVDWWTVE